MEDISATITGGIVNGLLIGARIMAPYVIGFCAICVVIAIIKRVFRKK